MSGKETRIQVRCSEKTREKWERMLSDIDPMGDKEESIEKIIGVWEANPSIFRADYR